MEVKEKEIIIKEKVYELTERELDDIKNEYIDIGRNEIAGYIGFCWNHFYLEMNVAGLAKFCNNLISFLNKETNIILNAYGYSFRE